MPKVADGITPVAIQSSIPKPPRHSKSELPFQQGNNKKYCTNSCELVNNDNESNLNALL